MGAAQVMSMVDRLFGQFETLVSEHGLFKADVGALSFSSLPLPFAPSALLPALPLSLPLSLIFSSRSPALAP